MKLNIAPVLARKNIKQSALADAINVNKGYVSELISGKKEPSLETLRRIVEFLDVPVGELFGEIAHEPAAQADEAPGFRESDVAEYQPGETRDPLEAKLLSAASGLVRSPVTYRATTAIGAFAIQPGDLLIVDLAGGPVSGDMVLVGLTDQNGFNARTIICRLHGHIAVAPEPAFPDAVLDLQTSAIASWRGSVRAIVRAGLQLSEK